MTDTPPYVLAIYGAKTHFAQLVENTGTALNFTQEALHARIAVESNPYILKAAQANPSALQKAIYQVATVGLSLNKATAYAFLVPRDGIICLDISYRGLVKIATDTGSIMWAKAEIVHAKDLFTMREIGLQPRHEFSPFGDRGPAVGVYCVAKTVDNDFLAGFMTADEINAIRDKSPSYTGSKPQYSPWNTFTHEMWKKVIIKRESKSWPKTERSDRLQVALDVVNEHDGVQFQPQHSEEQYSYFLSLTEVDKEQPLSYYIFIRSLDIEEHQPLIKHHRAKFEHGTKKVEDERIGKIFSDGQDAYDNLIILIDDQNDGDAVTEAVDELSDDELDFLLSDLSQESANYVENLINNQ